ncbi:hypothetical protein PQR33_22750 [Paraburkholderia sediminicola]|uniref:hypothetical protein n=1 Tax=Paraburkholderia sediminicola TaxID=458836 RepID=UPI0038BB8961
MTYRAIAFGRPTAEDLHDAFLPYMDWALKIAAEHSGIAPLCAAIRDYSGFHDAVQLALDAIDIIEPPPIGFARTLPKIRIIGGLYEPATTASVAEAARHDAHRCYSIASKAGEMIREFCMTEQQRGTTERTLSLLRSGTPVDLEKIDPEVLAWAMTENYFDPDQATFHARKKWDKRPFQLGYIDEPRYGAVRYMPRVWLSVVLGVYGVASQFIQAMKQGGAARTYIEHLLGVKPPAGLVLPLGRWITRELVLAMLPVVVVQPQGVRDYNAICGAFVVVPTFPGVDSIAKAANLVTFPELNALRGLQAGTSTLTSVGNG